MFDSHGYYGQPGPTAQQFLPPGLFGTAPTPFAPYGSFGTLPAPWAGPSGPAIGGWPGQLVPGAFAPQGPFGHLPAQHAQAFDGNLQFTGLGLQSPLFGNLPGQMAQPIAPYAQMGQPPIGHPFGGWPGQMQLACITPQGLVAILPGQFAQPIGLGQPIRAFGAWPGQPPLGNHFGAAAGRSFLPYQVPVQMAYA